MFWFKLSSEIDTGFGIIKTIATMIGLAIEESVECVFEGEKFREESFNAPSFSYSQCERLQTVAAHYNN